MPVAIETLHPDVYVVETTGRPRVIGVSVNNAGFIGMAEKGPIYQSLFITNMQQFYDRYGEFFRGSFLEPALRYFFQQGGTRCYVGRVVGQGAAVAWTNAKDCGESGGPAVAESVAGPFNLDPGEHLDIDISGYATQIFTFTGTQAKVIGNGFTGASLNGKTFQIQFSGWDVKNITFAGLPDPATPTDVANFLNPLLQGGACIVNGANIDFQADQKGSGSFVHIIGGNALTALGHNVFKTHGTGNVPNIDRVTAAEAAVAISATLVGGWAIEGSGGKLQIVSRAKGDGVTVQVLPSSTATAFGFDNLEHRGWGNNGSQAVVVSGFVETFNLEDGEVLSVDISGQSNQNFTFSGTQAVLNGSGYTGAGLNGLTLQIQFSGYDGATITFSGLSDPAPIQEVVDFIQSRIRGGSVEAVGGDLRFKADQYGSGSSVVILGGTGLVPLGLVVGGAAGSGNVANVNAVTAQEVVNIINASITGGVAEVTTNGGVLIRTLAYGNLATIQVNAANTTARNLGFDFVQHVGSDADFMDAILFRAANPGAWGNNVTIRTTVWAHTLRKELVNTDTEIYVSSVRGVSLGDIIYTYDPSFPSKRYVGLVTGIDPDLKILSVLPIVTGLVGIIPNGSPIMSSSQHDLVTRTREPLVNAADHVALLTTSNLKVGSLVTISDGVTMTDVKVTQIDGNVIRFAPVSLSAPIAANAVAASQEWRLQVIEKGMIKETIEYLSMEEESPNYFVSRLSGNTNESLIVEAIDLYAAPREDWRKIPLPTQQALQYGLDGATPGDNDFIGSIAQPRTGIYLFDDVLDLNYFAVPGITSLAVQAEMISYAERRGVVMCILDAPKWADLPQEIYNYRMFTLNADSSQSALYYPWVIVRDPIVNGGRLALPPSGHIAGEFARTAATRGVHVAPANVVLSGVLDLTYKCSDAEQDILNPVGINAIRWFPGEGIRIWGCRTLFNIHDGRHYVPVRRLLNFIKESIRRGNRWAVFQPNDPRLWSDIEETNKEFLYALWSRGMLFPSNDQTKAFFVKCDAETNPMSEIREGRVNCEIGINPPFPAEFVIFRIGIWDGGTSVAEEIARRG